uniref:Uncharacterized protein n=1 Tax=viral metagenome TaxID=1070528 RepID=A0A6M3LTR6_9ZZZZ
MTRHNQYSAPHLASFYSHSTLTPFTFLLSITNHDKPIINTPNHTYTKDEE